MVFSDRATLLLAFWRLWYIQATQTAEVIATTAAILPPMIDPIRFLWRLANGLGVCELETDEV